MAKQLKKHNIQHELFAIPVAGHGLGGGDRKLVRERRLQIPRWRSA
jgi:hypothetical protein